MCLKEIIEVALKYFLRKLSIMAVENILKMCVKFLLKRWNPVEHGEGFLPVARENHHNFSFHVMEGA